MPDIVIAAENLSKLYRLGRSRERPESFVGALASALRSPLRNLREIRRLDVSGRDADARPDDETLLWALRDVSFEVRRGEVVGFIGRNGAGKSTLLKILSRVAEPSSGRVRIRGRLASRLEGGTGFHPDLTGRENVYLNGTILGMSKREVDRKFDEIVAFSGVERFLDTPVKRYSSGMKVRLGFAVAAHLEPDILIVDEVLAVGDAEFQARCMGKMREVASGEGRTVLFVSHNMVALRSLCSKALYLIAGRVEDFGDAEDVVARYLGEARQVGQVLECEWPGRGEVAGNHQARLVRARIEPGPGGRIPITTEDPFDVVVDYQNDDPNLNLCISLVFRRENEVAFNTVGIDDAGWYGNPVPAGLVRSRCRVPGELLNSGRYEVQVYLVLNDRTLYRSAQDALVLDVADRRPGRCSWYGDWRGATRPILPWHYELVDPGSAGPTPADHLADRSAVVAGGTPAVPGYGDLGPRRGDL
jgi:lipopolysaccharide transport system ATP-binding protein